MKRKLTLFLSAVMATSCLPMTAYAANFKDINAVPWASSVINDVADKGLISGFEDNTFRGAENVTYCQAMQMVYNVLQKTGTALYMDATKTYGYMQTLQGLGVPTWAQIAVAYGLENGLISMNSVMQNFAGDSKKATREDVARMFGSALAVRYDYERAYSAAAEFGDYWRISDDAVPQVDLLKRLGIISGDNLGNFYPKNNITRAEMAVILSNTCSILSDGTMLKGKITDITNNEGEFYYIEVELDNGTKNSYYAMSTLTVYEGETNTRLPVSRLSKGDVVELNVNGGSLSAVRQISGVEAQAKYDVTGYLHSIKNGMLKLENENTGNNDEYNVNNSTMYFLEGVKIKLKDLEEELKTNSKKLAYVGVMTEIRRERNDSTKKYEDVTYAVEVHITLTDGYTTSGEVVSLSDKNISVKPVGSSVEKNYILADSCEIYIGGDVVTVKEAKELVKAGTTYAKITTDSEEEVTEIILSEDTFENSVTKADATTYKVKYFDDKKMVLTSSGKDTTYLFGSTNPTQNIAFYTWDSEDKEWDDRDVDAAEYDVDSWEAADKTVYCRIELNRGGKLSEVYFADRKSAWTEADHQSERKGTVASVEDGVLKFKTSTVKYQMLNQYNKDLDPANEDVISGYVDGVKVAYPLNNVSAVTSSLKVFEKMANDDAMELYAEIIADTDNRVLKIEAELKSAEGSLVKYDDDEDIIEIETRDGNTFRLNVTGHPSTGDEDTYTAEDLSKTGYIGSYVELGFNSSGKVNMITVTDSTYGSLNVHAEGMVDSVTSKGLKLEGSSKTYAWLPERMTNYDNFSMMSTSWNKLLNEILVDEDLDVFVKLHLTDADKIEGIELYVRGAEGILENFNDSSNTVRIKTTAGNRFTFDTKGTITLDFNNYTVEDMEDGDLDGEDVVLTFSSDGLVSKITKG